MNAEQLRALQSPLKDQYRQQPATATVRMRSVGRLNPDALQVHIDSWSGVIRSGLHAAVGGTGEDACSAEMLLESLVACAGVTLNAVATALGIPLRGGQVVAEADLDFRGTLGVDRQAPVGLQDIQLTFQLDSEAAPEQLEKLVAMTERYCVIYQTLKNPPNIATAVQRS
jgi:uncharacterized OsmC-like protein